MDTYTMMMEESDDRLRENNMDYVLMLDQDFDEFSRGRIKDVESRRRPMMSRQRSMSLDMDVDVKIEEPSYPSMSSLPLSSMEASDFSSFDSLDSSAFSVMNYKQNPKNSESQTPSFTFPERPHVATASGESVSSPKKKKNRKRSNSTPVLKTVCVNCTASHVGGCCGYPGPCARCSKQGKECIFEWKKTTRAKKKKSMSVLQLLREIGFLEPDYDNGDENGCTQYHIECFNIAETFMKLIRGKKDTITEKEFVKAMMKLQEDPIHNYGFEKHDVHKLIWLTRVQMDVGNDILPDNLIRGRIFKHHIYLIFLWLGPAQISSEQLGAPEAVCSLYRHIKTEPAIERVFFGLMSRKSAEERLGRMLKFKREAIIFRLNEGRTVLNDGSLNSSEELYYLRGIVESNGRRFLFDDEFMITHTMKTTDNRRTVSGGRRYISGSLDS